MKKILLFISILFVCEMSFSQTKVIIHSGSGGGGLAPIANGTGLGNTSGSSAIPVSTNIPMELISEQTVSAASSVDINLSSYYNVYYELELDIYNYVPSTTSTDLYLRFTADNSTYPSTGYKFSINGAFSDATSITTAGSYTSSASAGGAINPNTTAVVLMNGCGNQSGNNNKATLFISNLDNASFNPTVTGTVNYKTNGGNGANRSVWGEYSTAQVTEGLRLLPSSGTFSFKYRLYGRKK